MPYKVPRIFTCPSCGAEFESKSPRADKCPDCRYLINKERSVAWRREKYGNNCPALHSNPDRTTRDRSYDDIHKGKPESVYSSQCVISIKQEVGRCQFCRRIKNIVNGYCPVCRANGANEDQIMNPEKIRAERGRAGKCRT